MALSQCKWVSQEFQSKYPHCPHFFLFNYFRENIWGTIWPQFHFLKYQLVTYFTELLRAMASINKQNILGTVIQKRHNHIFGFMKILSKYLDILNCVFTMNSSTEKKIVFWSFIGQDFIRRLFKFFWTTNMHILFFWLNICIFTPVQTKKIAFGRKMSKIYPFIFYIFSLSN